MKLISVIFISLLVAACQPAIDKTAEEKKAQLAIPYTEKIPDIGEEKLVIRKPINH